MRITRLHIDRFGILAGQEAAVSPGLTIFLGHNEAGKSTCLQFFRAMLFGYKRGRQASIEPGAPKRGRAEAGGTLFLSTRVRGNMILTRRPGAHGGELTLLGPGNAPLPEEALQQVLSGLTVEVYDHIFAFSLNELTALKSLQGDSIRHALHGAAFGLGVASPAGVLKTLDGLMAEHLLKRDHGSATIHNCLRRLEEVDQTLREHGRDMERYEAAQIRLDETEKDLAALTAKHAADENARRRLERRLAAWPHWEELLRARAALAASPPGLLAPDACFSPDSVERLEALLAQKEERSLAVAAEKRAMDRLRTELDALPDSAELLALRPALQSLLEQKHSRREEIRLLPLLEREAAGLRREQREILQRLGSGWSHELALRADTSLFVRDHIRHAESRLAALAEEARLGLAALEQCARERARAEEQLSLAGEAVAPSNGATAYPAAAREKTAPWRDPFLLGAAAFFLAGAAGVAGGLLAKDRLFAVTGGVLCVLGMIFGLLRNLDQKNRAAARAEMERRHREETRQRILQERRAGLDRSLGQEEEAARAARQAGDAFRQAQMDWRKWLTDQGFSPSLAPRTAAEALDLLEDYGRKDAAAQAKEGDFALRLGSLRDFIRQIARLSEMAGQAGPAGAGLEEALAGALRLLEDLDAAMQRAAQRQSARAGKQEQVNRHEENLAGAEAALRATSAALAALLAAGKTADAETFRAAFTVWKHRNALREREEALMALLRGAAREEGTSGADFEASLLETSLEELEGRKQELDGRLAGLQGALQALAEERGRLKAEQAVLCREAQSGSLRREKAMLEEDLHRFSRRWSVAALARHLLLTAKERFEREGQSEVIRHASRLFQAVTSGEYTGVTAPLGEDAFFALHKSGAALDPEKELSQGTREQLYLALRLAYIKNHAEKAEPLPVVMDDILVNFDPLRAEHAANLLAEFARDNQILFFTCHPHTARLLAKAADRLGNAAPPPRLLEIRRGEIHSCGES